jgi:two-component system, OmpR family, alkaline phosphatase synthesis response regulator PhoP
MRPAPAILLLDADPRGGEQLAQQLAADGYRVDVARTVEHARVLAREHPPELALLGDLGESRATLALLEEIRRGSRDGAAPWDAGLPALVLGSGADRLDAIRAFEAGADDYLPTGAYLELRARVGALLRRGGLAREPAARVRVGELEIDARSRRASLADEPLELRRLEFDLLLHMAREPTRVFARRELLRSIWGYGTGCSTRTVDSHASRVRRKLDPRREGVWMLGVRGVGYRLR